jgi:hypothetical protein
VKKPVASSAEPKAHASSCPNCGSPAIELPFFSPRRGELTSVFICSKCNPSFYPKAEGLVKAIA